ncbi:ECF transporter S component [Mycetocola spongiae]|uniref:ECF transporter S component n=1 Tax=Mycetocola spongiae TaxID=2859226 RepID=UPI001CF1D295|nr:ECF transporter S component [Mycetocola spongiae]UCR88477.1 ECF transporter S component [Mycetocola spongiae]
MHKTNTRLLLTCAAIGVGAGIPLAVAGYMHVVVLGFVPVLYGFLLGLYFFPGVIAQWLLRRPGVAILTGLIAGLTSAALDPTQYARHIGTGLLIGLIQELPFALGRYRYWAAWLYYSSALFGGVVIAVIMSLALGTTHFGPVAQVISVAVYVLSPVFFTWLARQIAGGIDRTGVVRGIQYPVDRRRPRGGAALRVALA